MVYDRATRLYYVVKMIIIYSKATIKQRRK